MGSGVRITENERVFSEWDWEKNSILNIDPYKITQGSTKRVFWLCSKNHSWKARIDHRYLSGSNCPYCQGLKAVKGENDLATLFPDLLLEWDYSENTIDPTEILPGSGKKAKWICAVCGNHYDQSINKRTNQGGCPACAKMKRSESRSRTLIAANGSLEANQPELIKMWDYEKNTYSPAHYSEHSNKKVFWKCEICGQSTRQKINDKVNGMGCPVCSGKIVVIGINDIKSQFPELAREWDYENNNDMLPEQFTKGSDMAVNWKDSFGHKWIAAISSRTQGHGCPICAGIVADSGKNDLATVNPSLVAEWMYDKNVNKDPTKLLPNSNKKAWWKCTKCGNEWQAVIGSRYNGRGCPKCGRENAKASHRQTIVATKGSLADNYPWLEKEWDYDNNKKLLPSDISAGSDEKVWWHCRKGHSWEATISSRRVGNGCPMCAVENHSSFPEQAILYYFSKVTIAKSRERVFGKEVDIYLPELNIGIEYNGSYWHNDKADSDEKKKKYLNQKGLRIIIVCDGEVNSSTDDLIKYISKKTDYSPLNNVISLLFEMCNLKRPDVDIERDRQEIYSNYIVSEKENSIENRAPNLCNEWDWEANGELSPSMISFGSSKKIHWICKKGHKWEASVYSRVKGNGCPVCANRLIVAGENDLLSRFPEIASEWHPWRNGNMLPDSVGSGAHKKVWWLCKNGHEWQAVIKSRTGKDKCNCPVCAGKKM
ncbi:MAG: hypothetical protein MJ137_08100 [Clostridia bacterium]|nr:hypothetical protein [Clostridia bacterium]